MAQLKMYWFPGTPIPDEPLPEGYTITNYKCEEDKLAWVACCKNGLVDDDADAAAFDDRIGDDEDIDPYKDVFFLDYNGEHIGTFTAFTKKDSMIGDLHMVGLKTEFRGKGLSKYFNYVTEKKLEAEGVRFISLTTDEWRKGAVKSYLNGGFRPVQYNLGMEDRWQAVLEEYGIDSVPMYYEDGSFYKTIYRRSLSKKVRIGVFGAGRGQTMMNFCKHSGSAELVAVCDLYEDKLQHAKETYGQGCDLACYTDFDEFLKHDMDCVVLANYANEHAPYAIKCLEAGKHVLSEVLPVQTMREAVELIEAVERTGKIYAYAENYAYMPAPRKMRSLYRQGVLGKFEYGEGEYMHNCEPGWHRYTRCDPTHWRNTMSAFYYCTHSLGPLIHITGLRPVSVTGFEAPFNDRMLRMGAKAGAFGVEMVTLENGAILKSLHGVGPSKNSVWYSVYGSKGTMESSREIRMDGGVRMLYANCDEDEGDNESEIICISTDDDLTQASEISGHGGSDYYVMYNLVEAIRGNKNAEIVDVYEALDMFLPGMFAYYSVLDGGKPQAIPDLRDKAQREIWRNDTRSTDPKDPDNTLLPSYSKGNPEIPDAVYERMATYPNDDVTKSKRKELGLE
ncbi:MAG: Gfo/Idh/MocA family oxidoreductase [Clostridia bacterium]|nr:Gfo/Idh/MocA family oxidoreductase [Clostridia bacterium]